MPRVAVLVSAVLFAVVAGCGSDGDSNQTGTPASGPVPERSQNRQTYSKAQIVRALRLVRDPNTPGGLWDPVTKCTGEVIMTTPGQVDVYARAGDAVASNPSRTAGVKYSQYEGVDPTTCYLAFTQRLSALK